MFLEPDERLVLAWQVIEISNQCDHSHKKRHSILYGCALLENE